MSKPGFVFDGTNWVGFTGARGEPGQPARLVGTVATAADLPTPASPGDWCFVLDTNHVYGWDSTQATPDWVDRGKIGLLPSGYDDMDILTWDAALGTWVSSVNNFGDEANVNLSTDDTVTDGGVAIYEASINEWDVRRLALEDLDDIRGIVPNDGDILIWDATTSKWELRSLSSLGLIKQTP